MEISLSKIKESIGSFIVAALLFGGGWYYLDQQRLVTIKDQQDVLKLKIEADIKLQQYEKREKALLKKIELLESQLKEQFRDKELSALTTKFIDEMAGIDFHRQCGDNPDHNVKARKANALLSLIEAKALEYGRMEIVERFVRKQKFGIGGWSATCLLN